MGAATPPLNEARLNFLSRWVEKPSFSPIPPQEYTYFMRSCVHLLD